MQIITFNFFQFSFFIDFVKTDITFLLGAKYNKVIISYKVTNAVACKVI